MLSCTECHEIVIRVSSLAEFKAVSAQNIRYSFNDSIWDQVSNVNVLTSKDCAPVQGSIKLTVRLLSTCRCICSNTPGQLTTELLCNTLMRYVKYELL